MIREESLDQITDGRFYSAGDMVKIGTMDCKGCSECCRTTGDTIKLDPMDMWQLKKACGCGFKQLLEDKRIELQVVDGLILPNLATKDGAGCSFLSDAGRCMIHEARPGFCRLFPLGRLWESDDSFRYILQVQECTRRSTKVKIRKWLGIADLPTYEAYCCRWHAFTCAVRRILEDVSSEALCTKICTYLLEQFYAADWDGDADFYEQFDERLRQARAMIGMAPN